MDRRKKRILIGVVLILIAVGPQFSVQKNQKSDKEKESIPITSTSKKDANLKPTQNNSEKPVSESSKNEADIEKLTMKVQKLQKEMEKLKTVSIKSTKEVKRLEKEMHKLKSEPVKSQGKIDRLERQNDTSKSKITDWMVGIGTLLIAIGTLSIPVIGYALNRTQRDKMEQERKLGREKHLLDVFLELGSPDPRIRIGAAAILLQRLKAITNPEKGDIENKNNYGKKIFIIINGIGWIKKIKKDIKRKEEINEFFTIMKVLIAETKHEEKEETQKYIADGIVDALDARISEGETSPYTNESPLKVYDFQGTRFHNAWWKRIDARDVDFYEASLEKASLREAFLSKAILKKTNLTRAVLEEADLELANLQEAKLAGANLRGANLREALLEGANLQDANLKSTVVQKPCPETRELKEYSVKTDLSDAYLIKADLRGVDFREAIIDGANFEGAIFDEKPMLNKDQLKRAKFDKNISRKFKD